MGSWSVYCGISNISITSGDKCVLLPLQVNKKMSLGQSYLPFLPAMLPIFGTYNDYGGLEDIEKNINTKLIEDYFGINIEEFVTIFVDWKTYERSEIKPTIEKCKNYNQVEPLQFMFINRDVYDFLSSTCLNIWERGVLSLGKPEILNYLGFKFEGEDENNDTYDSKRFNSKWTYGDKIFYSDGNTLLNGKNNYIMYFNHDCNDKYSLSNHINIPEDKLWLGEKTMTQLWKLLSKNNRKEYLYHIFGKRINDMYLSESLRKLYFDRTNKEIESNPPEDIIEFYFEQIDDFGDGIAGLVTLRENLYAMSGQFLPFTKHLTPQCGDFSTHQIILEEFTKINKSNCHEE